MTLENLVHIGKLKPHESSPDEIRRMLEAARRKVKDAHVSSISVETRFDAAYKAVMQCAMVALLASGFRPSTNEPGHHVTVIQSLSKTMGLASERVVVLDNLRKRRNASDYTGEGVSEAQMTACIGAAEQLLADVETWLERNRPHPAR